MSELETVMVAEVEGLLARWEVEYAGRPDEEAQHLWLLALEREQIVGLVASVLCGSIVLVTGYIMGWRPGNGVVGVVAGLAVAVAFSYALSWFTACIGLRSNDPESAQAVGLLILFPIAFVSSCFVPTAGLPSWLRVIADWNPVSAVAGACRDLFGNPNPTGLVHNFPNQHPVLVALLWTAGILAVCVPLANRMLRARTVD